MESARAQRVPFHVEVALVLEVASQSPVALLRSREPDLMAFDIYQKCSDVPLVALVGVVIHGMHV